MWCSTGGGGDSGRWQEICFSETTEVQFAKLTQDVIQAYVDSGEPMWVCVAKDVALGDGTWGNSAYLGCFTLVYMIVCVLFQGQGWRLRHPGARRHLGGEHQGGLLQCDGLSASPLLQTSCSSPDQWAACLLAPASKLASNYCWVLPFFRFMGNINVALIFIIKATGISL